MKNHIKRHWPYLATIALLVVTIVAVEVRAITLSFTINNTRALELREAFTWAGWPQEQGEANAAYLERVTRQQFYVPVLNRYRRHQAEDTAVPVAEGDLP